MHSVCDQFHYSAMVKEGKTKTKPRMDTYMFWYMYGWKCWKCCLTMLDNLNNKKGYWACSVILLNQWLLVGFLLTVSARRLQKMPSKELGQRWFVGRIRVVYPLHSTCTRTCMCTSMCPAHELLKPTLILASNPHPLHKHPLNNTMKSKDRVKDISAVH